MDNKKILITGATGKQQKTTHPVESFLFFSSSEIYGDPEAHPQPESY